MFRLFLLCILPVFGTIHEIKHFSELKKYVNSESLVVLDIDDTLMIPNQMLGNGVWFEYRWSEYEKKGLSRSQALEKTLAEWEAIRHLSKMHLVENEIKEIIDGMQKQGITLVGITFQGLALATRTVLQLNEHNIDLSLTSIYPKDRCVEVGKHTVLYRKGILFTSGMPKGKTLFTLCNQIGRKLKRVVAVDDKREHLVDLEKEARLAGVEFIGLRYGFADFEKERFSPELVEYQFTHSTFSKIVSDEEAMAICFQE